MAKKKASTGEEKSYMGKVASLGCIVCFKLGYGYSPCEIHHPRTGTGMGQRSNHKRVIGLCAPHHRTGGLGVALHAGQKTFEANFGTEAELLEMVDRRLECQA